MPWLVSVCWSFSQIRGTPPHVVGRRPGSMRITVRMSPIEVTVKPCVIDAHQWHVQRSTTCALGR